MAVHGPRGNSGGSQVHERTDCFDVCLERVRASVGFEDREGGELRVPKIYGQYLRIGRGCPAQVGHICFEYRRSKNQGYLFLVSREKEQTIGVCKGMHYFGKYSEKDRAQLKNA